MQNSTEQPDQQPLQDTLVYADIGPSSIKRRAIHVVTLNPEDMDNRVEYALVNHTLQKPTIETNHDSIAGKVKYFVHMIVHAYLAQNLMKMTLLILTLY